MSITGKDLANKIQELMPERKFRITPEILNETCQHSSVQPFLKWFVDNVGPDNILSNEEIRIRKNLQESGVWLKGDELDAALNEAVKDCPELLALIEPNSNLEAEVSKAYEAERAGYDADLKDLSTVENSLKTLKELEIKVDEDIEKEEAALGKLRIAENKLYNDCLKLIEEWDSAHREMHEKLQELLQVYTEAAKNRGPIISWTQVPLELFIKQIETYYNYLLSYIRSEYESLDRDTSNDSINSAMTNNVANDGAQELMKCQVNLITSKMGEIDAKICRYGYKALADKAKEIYNDGNLQIPQTETQLSMEIAELKSKRDLLVENNRLLEERLTESIENYVNVSITQILVENGEARKEGKTEHLAKLEHLLHLAQDMGHAQPDLLFILMQMQLRKLKEIKSFITDARYFTSSEYTHSSRRTAVMQEIQSKYESIISSSPCDRNVFNKIFTTMTLDKEDSPYGLELAYKKYDEITAENSKLKSQILYDDLNAKIANLKSMEKELIDMYDHEINDGPTRSFKIMPNNIAIEFENATKNVKDAQASVSEIRKKLKTFMSKIAQKSLDREKTILWQRFLADPDGLRDVYSDAERIVSRSYFLNSLGDQ